MITLEEANIQACKNKENLTQIVQEIFDDKQEKVFENIEQDIDNKIIENIIDKDPLWLSRVSIRLKSFHGNYKYYPILKSLIKKKLGEIGEKYSTDYSYKIREDNTFDTVALFIHKQDVWLPTELEKKHFLKRLWRKK